ncbi:MAG: alpha/beta fold hydrolase [Promethearchaeota archaeon]
MKIETQILNAQTRKELSGKFIKLSQGWVHYELNGPENGSKIVLVHGFSIPMFIWNPVFKFLTEAGFRVLRFDLYGRGYSDRPKVPNNLHLFENQVLEIVQKLAFSNSPFNLIGLSMGGAISMLFTLHHPDLVNKLILVDPAGLPMKEEMFPAFLKIPVLGKVLFRLVAPKRLSSNLEDDLQHPESFPNFKQLFLGQYRFKGYFRSILSTIQNFPMEGLESEIRELGSLAVPIQLFWGEEDTTLPYYLHEDLCNCLPSVEFHSIAEAKHVPFLDQPDIVNPLMKEFIEK